MGKRMSSARPGDGRVTTDGDVRRSERSAAARRRFGATDLALIAVFAALIAVLGMPGQVNVAGNAVPITFQTLGVMLAGAVLGARRGMAAVAVLIALVAAGLPLLAGGRGGLAVFAGPSAGYLVGWLLGAAVIGLLVERRLPAPSVGWTLLACVLGGIGFVYLLGIPVQAARLHMSVLDAAKLSLVFLPGDVLKAVVAAVVAGAVHRANPGLIRPVAGS